MKYDVVLVEKLPGEGLSVQEVSDIIRSFEKYNELITIEIDSTSGQSSAMGFITANAEQSIYGNDPRDFELFIGSILADVNLEREDHIYEYAGQKIWLGRSAPDCIENPPRIEIPLNRNVKLVAEQNADRDYKEIFVGIEKTDGMQDQWWQDLAVVREEYTYSEQGTVVNPVHGKYEVFVFGNENDEDYTESYQIQEYEEQ